MRYQFAYSNTLLHTIQLIYSQEMSNSTPFTLNPSDYEVGPIIGWGSSAVVKLARFKPLNRMVAIKVVDMDLFERSQVDQLRNELQIQSSCRHPHVVSLFGSFLDGSQLHILQPYFAQGSVLDILKFKYPDGLPEQAIQIILKQALLGLEYLHNSNLIHRDIKAGNLLVDDDGTVALADFGVSSSLAATSQSVRKTFVGTTCYMSPEIISQSGYDNKTDIWSFGITALELAQGRAPYSQLPPLKVLMMTLQSDPPTLDRTSTKHPYSDGFKQVIDMCLRTDPKQRPSCTNLLQHPFFTTARAPSHLKTLILTGLPQVAQRQKPIPRATPAKKDILDLSWDFEDPPLNPQIPTEDNDTPSTVGSERKQSPPPVIPTQQVSQVSLSSTPTEIRKGRFSVVSPEENPNVPHPMQRVPSINERIHSPLSIASNVALQSPPIHPIPGTRGPTPPSVPGTSPMPASPIRRDSSRFQVAPTVQVSEKLQWLFRQNQIQRQGLMELASVLGIELEPKDVAKPEGPFNQ